jgi:uncharacterized protein
MKPWFSSQLRWLRQFINRFPIAYSLLAIIITGTAPRFLLGNIVYGNDLHPMVRDALGIAVTTGCVISFAVLMGQPNKIGLTSFSSWQNLRLLTVPFAALALLLLGDFDLTDKVRVFVGVPAMLLTGFNEEVMFRGIVLWAFLKTWAQRTHGILLSVIASSLIFGVIHLLNLVAGDPWQDVVSSVILGVLLGVVFAGLRLRTHTVWLIALLHGLINTIGNALQAPSTEAFNWIEQLPAIGLAALLAVYGLYIIRRVSITSLHPIL